MTRRFRFALSGSCAVLAALLCALYGQHVHDEADRVRAEALERYGGEVVSLVVAPEGLEAGEVVDGRNAIERDWLADLAPDGAVVDLEDVMGDEVTIPAAEEVELTMEYGGYPQESLPTMQGSKELSADYLCLENAALSPRLMNVLPGESGYPATIEITLPETMIVVPFGFCQ